MPASFPLQSLCGSSWEKLWDHVNALFIIYLLTDFNIHLRFLPETIVAMVTAKCWFSKSLVASGFTNWDSTINKMFPFSHLFILSIHLLKFIWICGLLLSLDYKAVLSVFLVLYFCRFGWGGGLRYLLNHADICPHHWGTFFLPRTRHFTLLWPFPILTLESSISPRKPCSFCWGWQNLRSTGHAHCYGNA